MDRRERADIEPGVATMRKIEPSGFRRMPWKNGGGETAEIAIGPAGATADDFDWRVSTARVVTPGPFSHFQGIDRSLVVLSGNKLRLVTGPLDGNQVVVLDRASAPFQFAGDMPAYADLVGGGPVVDFNVMTRRAGFRHVLRKISAREGTVVAGGIVVLYCLAGSAACRTDSDVVQLAAGEALVSEDELTDRPMPDRAIRIECHGADDCELLTVQMFSQGTKA
jgi:environmental stress-induced protein Ves